MNKKVFSLIIFTLLFVSVLGFVTAAETDATGAGSEVTAFLEKIPANEVLTSITNFLGFGATWKQIILNIIVFLILFVGMNDILTLTSIFRRGTNVIISLGLAVIALLTGIIVKITALMLSLVAVFGTIGIILEIVIAIVIFIGLSLANDKIATWAAKKYGHVAGIKAMRSSSEMAAAGKSLRQFFQDALNKTSST